MLKSALIEATGKRQQREIPVSTVLKPEAGRRSEICLLGAGSVEELAMSVWLLAVQLLKNYAESYSDQVFHHPSLLSSKSLINPTMFLFSSPISVFLFLSLVQVGRFFYQWYLHFKIFRFSSPSPSLVARFFINWSFVRFSPLVSYWIKRFFTSSMILFGDSSASLRG